VVDQTDAVLEAWYPGSEGGRAVADLLYGEAAPTGRLSMSFPYSAGQIPVYYNQFNTGRPKDAPDAQEYYVSRYLDIPNEPLFPFGFGLSYTNFSYSDAKLSAALMTPETSLTVLVCVTNTGEIPGEEIVQLYVRDITGEVVRPLKELKAFQHVFLQPGEMKEVTFTLTEEQLRYHHTDLAYKSDAGSFAVYVGPNSRDAVEMIFNLEK
jgi:beta-glucosidase